MILCVAIITIYDEIYLAAIFQDGRQIKQHRSMSDIYLSRKHFKVVQTVTVTFYNDNLISVANK